MDDERFDRIAKLLGSATARRGALRGMAAAALGLGLSRLGSEDALGSETALSSEDVTAAARCSKRRCCKKTGYLCCRGSCRHISSDKAHCGGCASANRCSVSQGQTCRGGRCVCADGRLPCGKLCCAATEACFTNSDGTGGVCAPAGTCAPPCADGRSRCGGICCAANESCNADEICVPVT